VDWCELKLPRFKRTPLDVKMDINLTTKQLDEIVEVCRAHFCLRLFSVVDAQLSESGGERVISFQNRGSRMSQEQVRGQLQSLSDAYNISSSTRKRKDTAISVTSSKDFLVFFSFLFRFRHFRFKLIVFQTNRKKSEDRREGRL
jgi:hypothetical protein